MNAEQAYQERFKADTILSELVGFPRARPKVGRTEAVSACLQGTERQGDEVVRGVVRLTADKILRCCKPFEIIDREAGMHVLCGHAQNCECGRLLVKDPYLQAPAMLGFVCFSG